MELCAATPADVSAVTTLVRAAYAKWVPLIGREPLPMRADYDAAIRDHVIELLYEGGALVGLIETIAQPDHLFIENIAVAPAHRGQGIGRGLLAHAERIARGRGVPEIRLSTNSAFESNIRLYRSVGYRIDRREPFMDGEAVYMSKKIASP